MKPEEAKLRRACTAAANTLKRTCAYARPGMTTRQISEFVLKDTLKQGGYPAPYNYRGFPGYCCTSVNDVVCHGIPGDYVLQFGDYLNIDVTTVIDGHFGDTNRTISVGRVPSETFFENGRSTAISVAEVAMYNGIGEVKPWAPLRNIGRIVSATVKNSLSGFSIVREFGGHGIGTVFHAPPFVYHYDEPSCDVIMHPGMVFTIEPIVNEGSPEITMDADGWTYRTADGKRSAQSEHTVLVTETDCEILTVPDF